jgi:hypothetical protein
LDGVEDEKLLDGENEKKEKGKCVEQKKNNDSFFCRRI